MTVTSSARRTDQLIQLGSRHGYRIDGDQAFINAELSVPAYHPGGAWALELWASEQPFQGGELVGTRVSDVQLELPTPLGPHTHRIEASVPARLPLQGRAYFMLLALVELGAGERRVRDVASYPALDRFPAPQLQGEVGYEVRGHEVLLQAAAVANPRGDGNLSGTLSLDLWAWAEAAPLDADARQGLCLGAAQLTPVAGGEPVRALECRAPFRAPPVGTYRLALLLREWTQAHGYLTRDRRDFALPFQVLPPEAPAEPAAEGEPLAAVVADAPATPVLSEPAAAAPTSAQLEEPELDWDVPEPAPALSVPEPPASVTVPRGSRVVSLNLASVEELARLKGLNNKLAREIVKRRPFSSIDQLLDVRGIGKKTLDKLRTLLAL